MMLEKAGSGTVDYVDEFAGKLPMDVISELMGVPEKDRDQVRAWADGVMHRDEGVPTCRRRPSKRRST